MWLKYQVNHITGFQIDTKPLNLLFILRLYGNEAWSVHVFDALQHLKYTLINTQYLFIYEFLSHTTHIYSVCETERELDTFQLP